MDSFAGKDMGMRILIGADLVPTLSNYEAFEKGDVDALIGQELLEIFKEADYRVFNLEVPLTDCKSPILKCGPNLIAPQSVIQGIKKLGVDLFTLANNHILDQGEQGLVSTFNILKESNVNYVGAGLCIDEAKESFILEKEDIRVGVYACAETEFSIATRDLAGANPFDPLESFDHVQELSEKCDYVVVLYHGGKEHYRYPSPYLQKVCRKFVEKGADLVITQHSHCIGAKETYNEGTIVYGQGNFIFDYSDNEFWNTSLLLDINVGREGVEIEYIPLQKVSGGVRLAAKENAFNIIREFEERSLEIKDEKKVEKLYVDFADKQNYKYEQAFLGKAGNNILFRIINKLSNYKFVDKFFSESQKVAIYNYIVCEAHRELLLAGLKGTKNES